MKWTARALLAPAAPTQEGGEKLLLDNEVVERIGILANRVVAP